MEVCRDAVPQFEIVGRVGQSDSQLGDLRPNRGADADPPARGKHDEAERG
jgi:hypothetical protein